MAVKITPKPKKEVVTLNMNGLRGRMLYLPPPARKKRQILLLYGQHSSIERLYGLARELNHYGGVTMPDLPGFGGMQSFYRMDEKPTLDNLADYLEAFIKLRYKRRRVTIVAHAFGFIVATRMLQRSPELVGKVELLVSLGGFSHHEDFCLKKRDKTLLRLGARLFSRRLPAWLVHNFVLRKTIIKSIYSRILTKRAASDNPETDPNKLIAFETRLWQRNDFRTHMETAASMLSVDLCKKRVDLPVYHVAANDERYFDKHVVEQHLNVVFKKVNVMAATIPVPLPTIIDDPKKTSMFLPAKLRRLLARS